MIWIQNKYIKTVLHERIIDLLSHYVKTQTKTPIKPYI
jgi:hypothetical protein